MGNFSVAPVMLCVLAFWWRQQPTILREFGGDPSQIAPDNGDDGEQPWGSSWVYLDLP